MVSTNPADISLTEYYWIQIVVPFEELQSRSSLNSIVERYIRGVHVSCLTDILGKIMAGMVGPTVDLFRNKVVARVT